MSVAAYGAGDAVSAVLGSALDGLSVRQRVIADNIANVDTPGFRATSAEFEGSLRSAIASDARDRPAVQMVATQTPVGANDNNVDLRKESMAAMQTQFQYQLMTRAVADRFELTKIAAG